MSKIYHIYLKNECIYHSLSPEEFVKNWEILCYMLDFMNTKYKVSDLSYVSLGEEIEIMGEPNGTPSY